MKIVALIPARSGSKRITHKNLRQINGIPLLCWAVKQAFEVDLIDEVYVSTDNEIYAEIAKNYGAKIPFLRPKELSQDNSIDYDVFIHFLKWYKNNKGEYPDYIVQIRPTAPLRNSQDIKKAIEIIINDNEADSLRTVSIPHQTPYKMWRKDENTNYLHPLIDIGGHKFDGPTQKLPKTYAQDGVVDIIRCNTLLKYKNMAGKNIIGYCVHDMTWDIDRIQDLEYIEKLMENKREICLSKKSLGASLGIIQGRLTKAEKLQQFPTEWQNEFEKARKAGYSYIELIRDREYNKENPLWNNNLKEIIDLKLNNGIATRVICDDYIQECDWENLDYERYLIITDILCKAKKIKASIVVFPIFEKAMLTNKKKEEFFIKYMKGIAKIAEILNIYIAVEMTEKASKMKKILNEIGSKNIGICIDTGNLITAGYDATEYFYDNELRKKIIHVHIKDKSINGKNVVLGKGIVDFYKVMHTLENIGYTGYITTETDRGKNPLNTAIHNKKYLINKM